MTPMEKVDVLRAACCVAGIDGAIGDPERQVIKRLADEVGVGRASLEAMMDRGQRDAEFYREQFRVLKVDPQESMAVLLEVALADGALNQREVGVLEALSQKLAMPPSVFAALVARVNRDADPSTD